jgi:hypothetical protein
VGRSCPFSSAPPSHRACGSPAHGAPTFFTVWRSASPARADSAWGDAHPLRLTRADVVTRLVGDDLPAQAMGLLVALGHVRNLLAHVPKRETSGARPKATGTLSSTGSWERRVAMPTIGLFIDEMISALGSGRDAPGPWPK